MLSTWCPWECLWTSVNVWKCDFWAYGNLILLGAWKPKLGCKRGPGSACERTLEPTCEREPGCTGARGLESICEPVPIVEPLWEREHMFIITGSPWVPACSGIYVGAGHSVSGVAWWKPPPRHYWVAPSCSSPVCSHRTTSSTSGLPLYEIQIVPFRSRDGTPPRTSSNITLDNCRCL
jgi:hypothetical protein